MTSPVQRTVDGREELLLLIATAVTKLVREWQRLTDAQDSLLRSLERIRPGAGSTTRIRTAVRDFNAQVGEFDRAARAFAERWAAQDLPTAYRDGALRALERAGADVTLFRWTADHQAAITALTASFYVDLIGRIQEAVRRAQAFVRDAQDAARAVAAGRQHAGIGSARLAADHPLSTIVYRDNSRHPVKAWADSTLTWQGVVTANHAAINAARLELDAQWMQVRDGPECVMPGGRFLPHGHLEQMVRSWFSGPAYLIQTRTPVGTNLLTVGPNHPVLTKRGWVRAHLLSEGDELVYDRLSQDPTALTEFHLKEVPMVEDVYASLVESFPVSVRATTSNDLHCDGQFCQGEIDVVTVAGSLLIESDAALPQHVGEHNLVRADDSFPAVVGDRSSMLHFGAKGYSAQRLVSCPGTFFSGLGPGVRVPQGECFPAAPADTHVLHGLVHLGERQTKGLRNIRRLASLFDVQASYLLTRKTYGTRPGALISAKPALASPEGVEGGPARLADAGHAAISGGLRGPSIDLGQRVCLSRIESIAVKHYEGWVYDATTSGGTFTVDGLIVANCGWVSHQDTDHADGTIRSVDDCAAYPSAHHGCIREFIPRPDLNGRRGLVSGDPA